jgi:hypothetical protein
LAVSKILCIGSCGAGYAGKHLSQALDYISKKEKTGDGRWEGCLNCLPGTIYQQMRQTKEHFGKTDKRQGYHIILSFAEGEVDAAAAFKITGKFAREYLGSGYEALYTVHDNTDHIHAHIIFNSVSFCTGNKYHYKKGDWAKDTACYKPTVHGIWLIHYWDTRNRQGKPGKWEKRQGVGRF